MRKLLKLLPFFLITGAHLSAAGVEMVDTLSEINDQRTTHQPADSIATPQVKDTANASIPITFGKEVEEGNTLAGNLFGGLKNAEHNGGDETKGTENSKESSTSITQDITPMAFAETHENIALDALTLQQLRELLDKMKIPYRLIDSKEVLIRKILVTKNS